jgi:hypothetical protein
LHRLPLDAAGMSGKEPELAVDAEGQRIKESLVAARSQSLYLCPRDSTLAVLYEFHAPFGVERPRTSRRLLRYRET